MTPADEMAAAARRLRSNMLIVRADLDPLLAAWLETTAARLDHATHPDWQDVIEPKALAVARAILATGGQP